MKGAERFGSVQGLGPGFTAGAAPQGLRSFPLRVEGVRPGGRAWQSHGRFAWEVHDERRPDGSAEGVGARLR